MVQLAKFDKVDELIALFKGAKSIILNDYKGLDVAAISQLRRECHENNVIFKVVKNTLATRAFEKMGREEMNEFLSGPTAIAVSSEEEVLPAQILKKFADEHELPRFKGALVNGRIFDEKMTVEFASLPSKKELQAKLVGTLQNPVRGLVICLDASLRNLVCVLQAISEKKGAA